MPQGLPPEVLIKTLGTSGWDMHAYAICMLQLALAAQDVGLRLPKELKSMADVEDAEKALAPLILG